MDDINLLDIKQKIIEKLQPSGWGIKLRSFITSEQFDKILKDLYNLKQEDKRFTPPLKYVFRAFEECPDDKNLKIVMLGQDVYPQLGIADGLAFSCSMTNKLQPSLKNIFEAINNTVYNDVTKEHDPNLQRWAKQGILLLNTAFTCEINKPGSHNNIWKDFTTFVIDTLNHTHSGLIFCLLGKQAQSFEDLIDDQQHTIIKIAHPVSSVYTGIPWDCANMFNECNKIIKEKKGKQIIW